VIETPSILRGVGKAFRVPGRAVRSVAQSGAQSGAQPVQQTLVLPVQDAPHPPGAGSAPAAGSAPNSARTSVLTTVGTASVGLGKSTGGALASVIKPVLGPVLGSARGDAPTAEPAPLRTALSTADEELLRMVQSELRELSRSVKDRRTRRRLVVASECLAGIGRDVKGPTLLLIPSREQASIARLTRAHRRSEAARQERRRRNPLDPRRVPGYIKGAMSKI
jgi:hypothetical protein